MSSSKILIMVLVTLLAGAMKSQAQRMAQGSKGLEATLGLLSAASPAHNYSAGVSLTINSSRGNYWILGASYLCTSLPYREDHSIPVATWLGEAAFCKRVASNRRKSLNLNLALGPTGGYERISNGKEELYDGALILDKAGFVYGAACRLLLETYLCDRLVLLVNGKITVLWGTTLSKFRPATGIGLRLNF